MVIAALDEPAGALEQGNQTTHPRGRIFPDDAAIVRLVGALMLEQNDERAMTRLYMTLETIGSVCDDKAIDVAKLAVL